MRLYLALLLRLLVPTAYTTFRLAILGSLPDGATKLSIASQMVWISIIMTTAEEALLVPLYHLLGDSIGDEKSTRNKVKIAFASCLALFSVISMTSIIYCQTLVTAMAQKSDLIERTVAFARLELLAVVPNGLSNLFRLVMVMHGWDSMLYLVLATQVMSSITLDFALVSDKVLDLGVMGVAYSNIGTSIMIFLVSFSIVWKKLSFTWLNVIGEDLEVSWTKKWGRKGAFQALESTVRNVVYLLVILRTMNVLEEQDSYWACTTMIWLWILPPVMALSELLRQDVADASREKMKAWPKLCGYTIIMVVIFSVWALSFPTWKLFIRYVLRFPEPETVFELILRFIPFCIFYSPSLLLQSVFYALGRTDVNAASSILSNVFLVLAYSIIDKNVHNMVLLMGSVAAFGLLLNLAIYYFIVIKRQKLL